MKYLSISGGSTKIAGQLGILEGLSARGQKFDLIGGVSSGSILSLPLAINKLDDIRSTILNISTKDIFTHNPFSLKGFVRVLLGYESLSDMRPVVDMLKSHITYLDFELYKHFDFPTIIIQAIDYRTGEKIFYNLKECSYENYINAVLASSSIPIATKSVKMDGKILYDSGVRDHIVDNDYIFSNWKISEYHCIYSRPNNTLPKDTNWKAKFPFKAMKVFMRTLDLMQLEGSLDNEMIAKTLCELNGIPYRPYYLPRVLNSLYDTDKRRINDLYNAGLDVGRNVLI